MKKSLAAAVVLTAGALGFYGPRALWSSEQAKELLPRPQVSGADKAQEEKAVLASLSAYKEAFNRGDADAVSRFYTDEAEMVDTGGETIRGRDAIRRDFTNIFKKAPGVQLELSVDSLRWLSNDVIVEHGSAMTTPKGDVPSYSTYSAVHVRQNGKWLISLVRESPAGSEARSPEEHLAGLAWLIGDWQDSDDHGAITFKSDWSKSRAFLMRFFTIAVGGSDEQFHGTEVIGWDPIRKAPKSFIFDSRGCMGEGHWLQKGDRWYCKVFNVLPDGRKITATHVYRPIDANRYAFQSISRTMDGQFLPDTTEVIVSRVPAAEKQ